MSRAKLFLVCLSLVFLAGCPDYPTGHDSSVSKDEPHPDGVTSVEELKKDGDHYLVTGADLHNVGPDLIGEKIKFRGTVRSWGLIGTGNMTVLTDDKSYYVQVMYSLSGSEIPDDLRQQIDKGGIQKGDGITLCCTIDSIAQESGPNQNVLAVKSCIVKNVDQWER